MAELIHVRVLGSIEVVGPQGPLALQGSIPRTLLARMAYQPTEPVSREDLIDALWDEAPPRTAQSTLRSHLTRLRGHLEKFGMPGLVVPVGIGYALGVWAEVDAHLFEQKTDLGRDLLGAGEAGAAVAEIRSALRLWRGQPLSDCRLSGWSRAEETRLNEIRMGAIENICRARIMLGEHEMLISELEQQVAQFPYRERLWEMMMLALNGAGRRGDALAVYQRARELFDSELGIAPGAELRQLHAAILTDEPTLDPQVTQAEEVRSAGNNIPAPPTSFVSRVSELAEIEELLVRARLVTLTGVGGVGKSRLAMRAAKDLRKHYSGGVWFVDLSVLREPDLILHLLYETLEVRDRTPRTLLEHLISHLQGSRALILFDNCEHVLDACAEVVDALLRSLPGLRILVTSRQALMIPGENIFTVAPLPLREDGDDVAARLFADRATAAVPGITLTRERDRELVAEICGRLEGIPLAIELAAVQLRVLSLQELLRRLDDRFQILSAGHRRAPKRHQTLLATIAWSFDLCTPREQSLWSRLSVFHETFDLNAAETVCMEIDCRHDDLLSLLAGLVEKSVLARESHPGGVRFRMLDSLREYGRSRLSEADAEGELLARHRDYYLRLAEEEDQRWFGSDQLGWLDRMRLELANLRSALEFCLNTKDGSETGLRLTAALHLFWIGCDFLPEGQYWLGQALDAGSEPTQARAHALWVAGRLDYLQGNGIRARARLDEAGLLALSLGDENSLTCATHIQGTGALIMGDSGAARDLLEHAVSRYRTLGGSKNLSVIANIHLAMSYVIIGDSERAIRLCQESLRACVVEDEQCVLSYGLYVLACAEHDQGSLVQALEHAREALRIKWRLRDTIGLAMTFDQLARTLAEFGQADRTALVLGGAQQCWNALGEPWFGSPIWLEIRQQAESIARRNLRDGEFETLFQSGCELPLDHIVSFAVEATAAGEATAE